MSRYTPVCRTFTEYGEPSAAAAAQSAERALNDWLEAQSANVRFLHMSANTTATHEVNSRGLEYSHTITVICELDGDEVMLD